MYIFLSEGPLPCILVSISNPVNCALLSDMSVCCVTAQWLVLPHLWTCARGYPCCRACVLEGSEESTYAVSSCTPKIQICACHVREKGCPARGWQGNGSQCAARHLFLEDAGTCRDRLF